MDKEVLSKFAEKILEWLNRGDAFLTAQVPDVIQQLIRWKMAENAIWVLVCAIILFFVHKFIRIIVVEIKNESDADIVGPGVVGIIFLSVVGLLGSGGLVQHLLNLVQLLVAPKIYLIEFLKDWLK